MTFKWILLSTFIVIMTISGLKTFAQTGSTTDDPNEKKYFLAVVNNDSIYVDRDSIINRYLKHGAWSFPIYNKEWQIYIDSALTLMPEDAYLWQQKSMPLFKQRKYSLGLQYLDSAIKYDKVKWISYKAFMECIFTKNYNDAIIDFKNAYDLSTSSNIIMDHSYNFYIGLCYLQLNNFDSALSYFNRTIQTTISTKGEKMVHFLEYFYQGIAYLEIGRDTKQENYFHLAIHSFDQALHDYPKFSDALFYKAQAMVNLGQYNEALPLLSASETFLKDGYTINEDNSLYEKYPYQIAEYQIDNYTNWVMKLTGK